MSELNSLVITCHLCATRVPPPQQPALSLLEEILRTVLCVRTNEDVYLVMYLVSFRPLNIV